MSNDSNSSNSDSYSSSNNDDTLRLSTDSGIDVNNNNQTLVSNKSSGHVTRSKKADLIFPVSRVENNLRKGRYSERLGSTASVFLAGVLEYLVAEIIELAGDKTHESKRKRITPRDISLVIKNDEELTKLCSNVTIPAGGVQPHIHEVLLNTNKRRRKRQVRFSQDIEYSSSAKKMKLTHNQPVKNNNVNTDTDNSLSSNSSDVDDSDLQMV